jgi:hypothetical protein
MAIIKNFKSFSGSETNESFLDELFRRKKSEGEKEALEIAKRDAIIAFRSWFRNRAADQNVNLYDKVGMTLDYIENMPDDEVVRKAKEWGRYETNGDIHTLWKYLGHHFPNVKI